MQVQTEALTACILDRFGSSEDFSRLTGLGAGILADVLASGRAHPSVIELLQTYGMDTEQLTPDTLKGAWTSVKSRGPFMSDREIDERTERIFKKQAERARACTAVPGTTVIRSSLDVMLGRIRLFGPGIVWDLNGVI